MCGIAGYVGTKQAPEVILNILRRLEYRGYDSAGMAILTPRNEIAVYKQLGKIADLEHAFQLSPRQGTCGIGHTRWATHGEPSTNNCHPQFGGKEASSLVYVVHNGMIENWDTLKKLLLEEGYPFTSETDTEVIAHLIAYEIQIRGDERKGLCHALRRLKGQYALAIMLTSIPGSIFVSRQGSPLVIGTGQSEYFISSDPSSLARYTSTLGIMADGQIVEVKAGEHPKVIEPESEATVGLTYEMIDDAAAESFDKGTFPHYMLKEIYEQPHTLENACCERLDIQRGTANFPDLDIPAGEMRRFKHVILTACGTSWHAGLIGRILLKQLAQIPAYVEYASEFRYDPSLIPEDTLIIVLSQSGETADTLGALRECKRRGNTLLALCNRPGSAIAREASGAIFLNAGPEIGVASTKAFTSQVMVLTLLSLHLGRLHHLSLDAGQRIIEELQEIPELVRTTLACNEQVREVAAKYAVATHAFYLGQSYNFPLALEGALKLKEISYIHAEGYPAAEMKHGPLALVDADMPTVFTMPRPGAMHEKIMSNVAQIRTRGGKVIAIAAENDTAIAASADEVIRVPTVAADYLQPLINILPLQLLAYHLAVLRGCDVDQPRNLAKSVTVE
jgi:glucosamine--fructose-6-phosphate aminotransferase (isomerizing)